MSIRVPPDIRALVEAEQLQRATALPSIVRTAVILGGCVAASLVAVWAAHPVVWCAVWGAEALVLNGAVAAAHEGVHGNLARHRGLNRALSELWSLLLPLNFSLYKAFHLDHHRWTRVEGDPEPQGEFRSLGEYFAVAPFTGLALVFQMWKLSLLALVGRFPAYVRTPRQRRAVCFDAVLVLTVTVGLVAAAVVAPRLVLLLWGVPVLLMSPIFALTALPEHYGCPRVPEPLGVTRSTLSNRIFNYLFWENNLHAEHHLLPKVPYHRQHRIRDALGDRVVHVSPSYVRWHVDLIKELWRASERR